MRKITIPILAMLLVFACSKEKESPEPVQIDRIDSTGNSNGNGNGGGGSQDDPISFAQVTETEVKQLLQASKGTPSQAKVNPTQFTTFNTSDGIRVQVPANALVLDDGTPVTEEVNIEITEFSTPADMIFNRVSTVTTDGQILESAGMMAMTAKTVSGKTVRFKAGKSMTLGFSNPAATKPGMRPFIGKVDAEGNISWETNDDWDMTMDTAGLLNNMQLDSFTYCNLDKFYKANSRGHMEIKVPEFSDDQSTYNFLVVKSARVCVSIPYESVNHYKTNTFYQIPLGEPATLIVMVISKNHLYFYQKDIVTEDNALYDLTKSELKPTSKKDFQTKMKSLNF